MRKLSIAALAAIGLMVTSSIASAQAICAPLLLLSAAYIGATQNRELTNREAFWCGLVREQPAATKVKVKKKKVVRREKKRQS